MRGRFPVPVSEKLKAFSGIAVDLKNVHHNRKAMFLRKKNIRNGMKLNAEVGFSEQYGLSIFM